MDKLTKCEPFDPSVFSGSSSSCELVTIHATFAHVEKPETPSDDNFSLIMFGCPLKQVGDYAQLSLNLDVGGEISYGIESKENLIQPKEKRILKECTEECTMNVGISKTSTGITMQLADAEPTTLFDEMPESGVFFVCFKNASGSVLLKSECMSGVCWARNGDLKPGVSGTRVVTQSFDPNMPQSNQMRRNQNSRGYSTRGQTRDDQSSKFTSKSSRQYGSSRYANQQPQQSGFDDKTDNDTRQYGSSRSANQPPQQSRFDRFEDKAGNDMRQFAHTTGVEMDKFGRAIERDAGILKDKARDAYDNFKQKEASMMVSALETLGDDFSFNQQPHQQWDAPVERQNTAKQEPQTPSITWDGLISMLSMETLDSIAANSIDDETCRTMTAHGKNHKKCVIKLCPVGDHSLYVMQIDNNTDVPLYVNKFYIGQIIAVVGNNPKIKIQTGNTEHPLIKLPHDCLFAIDMEGADLGLRAATVLIEKNEEISFIVSNEDVLKASFAYTNGDRITQFIVPPMETLSSQY